MQTIQYAIELRPFAEWGYYGFPDCNYDAGHDGRAHCNDSYQQINQK